MREALRKRSTLLLAAALLAGGVGGFALGRATDESSTSTPRLGAGLGIGEQQAALHAYIRSKQRTTTTPVNPADIPSTSGGNEEEIQIPVHIPQRFVGSCRDTLKETPGNESCRLLIKASNGQIEPGVYPESQRDELLAK